VRRLSPFGLALLTLSACSSFGSASGDGTVVSNDASASPPATSDDGGALKSDGAVVGSPGGSSLLKDDFKSACSAWQVSGQLSATPVPTEGHTAAGACQICATGVQGGSLIKSFPGVAGSGTFALDVWVKDGTPKSFADFKAEIVLVAAGGQNLLGAAPVPAAPTMPDWQLRAVRRANSELATTVRVEITLAQIDNELGCALIDDVALTFE
jgi:hypothetical protein